MKGHVTADRLRAPHGLPWRGVKPAPRRAGVPGPRGSEPQPGADARVTAEATGPAEEGAARRWQTLPWSRLPGMTVGGAVTPRPETTRRLDWRWAGGVRGDTTAPRAAQTKGGGGLGRHRWDTTRDRGQGSALLGVVRAHARPAHASHWGARAETAGSGILPARDQSPAWARVPRATGRAAYAGRSRRGRRPGGADLTGVGAAGSQEEGLAAAAAAKRLET